jgi:hypothetical protein
MQTGRIIARDRAVIRVNNGFKKAHKFQVFIAPTDFSTDSLSK